MAKKPTSQSASTVNEKLAHLEPRLKFIASKIARLSPSGDSDDFYQSILKDLLERSATDPAFFDQKDAYIVKYAEFRARHLAKKERVYLSYVNEVGCEVDPENSESDEETALDRMVERESINQVLETVEVAIMRNELIEVFVEGCDMLSEDNVKVVYLLYQGFKRSEIAAMLNISKPAVTQRIQTIASVLHGFVAGY